MQTRTRRQREVLEFISRYIDSHGFEPSYQLIARHLGISSKAAVAKHSKALEIQGLIKTRNESGQFCLELCRKLETDEPDDVVYWLDHNGSNQDDSDQFPFPIPKILLGKVPADRIVAFRVPDSLMQGDNICEGDIALIERRAFPRDGEIVAATLHKSATIIRRFFRSGASVELRPSNGDDGSVVMNADKISVLGVYRGLMRPIK
jgi:repressor LexA